MKLTRRESIASGSAALLLAACGQTGQRVFNAADTHPDGYPTVEGVRIMARLLEERSGGRLSTIVHPGGVLGEERDTLEITIFGGLDFNRVNLGPLNSIAKETLVPNLPFMFDSIDHMRKAVDGDPGNLILDSLSPHGLIGLCFYDSGARSFYTTDRLIKRPEDLSGLKIRVQNSDLFVALIEALGGDATPMSFGEVYQGLVQGVVDGAENNWPSFESTRHFEAARYYSLTRHVMAPEVLLMSARSWAKLSKDDQSLVRQCARDSVPMMREIWDAQVERSRQIVLAAGVEVFEPEIAPFRARVLPVWEKYLDSPRLRDLARQISDLGEEK